MALSKLGERFRSADGEHKTMNTRQPTFEPLAASDLFASVAAEWEDRPHRLPGVIEQVEVIAMKLKEWGWGEDIDRDELMHATIGYSRVVVSYECCGWLPFDLVPDWEDNLYCWLMDEDAWHEARDSDTGDSIQDLAERLRSEANVSDQATASGKRR